MKKVLLSLSFLSVVYAFGQKAPNQISFRKGQQLEVLTNITITAQSMMGPSSGTVSLSDTYTVNDAEENQFTLVKVPKKMKMNFSVGSQEIKIDSDNPQDLNSMFGQPVKEIMSQQPEFTIDASGKIIAVKGDEKKKKEDAQKGGMMGMMLPGMDLASALPQKGAPSFFQVLPNRQVNVGDTWTDSLHAEGNQNVTVYKVKDITANEIILDFTGNGTAITTQSAMGVDIQVNATTKATGNILIDKTTGVVKQKTSNNTTESTMNLGGREITSTIKSSLVTNVNSL